MAECLQCNRWFDAPTVPQHLCGSVVLAQTDAYVQGNEAARLRAEVQTLAKERDHWKYEHDLLAPEYDRELKGRQRAEAEVARLTREADWAHRGWDDARAHADQHEAETDALRTLVGQLVGALRLALPWVPDSYGPTRRECEAALAAAEAAGIR